MRKLFVIAVVLLLALAASGYAANQVKALSPEDLPFINIYNTPGSRPPIKESARPVAGSSNNLLVAMVCSNGQTVWSKNGISGGSPFVWGQIDPKILRKFISDLDKRGAFEDKALARAWFGPDSKTSVIEIKDGNKTLRMESWHELFEQNPKLIVTAKGVETLGARSREEVMKAQPEEYKHFREIWDTIRKTVESWTKK